MDSFLLRKHGLHWDAIPVPNLSIKSLKQDSFTQFAKKAIQSNRLNSDVLKEDKFGLLKKLHLIEGDYLRKATALLFYEEPEEYVIGAYIKIGFFKTNADLVYQDEIHGNLFQQVEKTMELLLTKYLKAYIRYDRLQRIEEYIFPEPVLREAVLNAVVHKDYTSGIPIQISVYENKIMFWNAGRLPDELTIELLYQKHPSKPFNPLIASTFFRAGYIEAWGRGIEKIIDECKRKKIPPPVIQCQFEGIMVSFQTTFNNQIEDDEIDFQINDDLQDSSKTQGKNSEKVRVKNNKKTNQKQLKTREKIIKLISKSPSISSQEIADNLGITKKAVEWQIKRLKGDNIIARVGPARGGKWEVIDHVET